MSSKKKLAILLILVFFTRFVGLNWGNNFFFHPDENNMAVAVSKLSPTNLNPHFFAYGQFPLYLSYYSLRLVNLPNTFSNAVYILRFWSAIFSILSVGIFYLIYPNPIFLILLIFSPGLIQISHFGTTESFLVFVFASVVYFCLRIFKNPSKFSNYFFLSLTAGAGLASKITALIFLTPFFGVFIKKRNLLVSLFTLSSVLLILNFFIFFSPYNLVAKKDFLSSMKYETEVATGKVKVFYTNQFLNSRPYIFQLVKVFPYTSGLPVFILSFFGFLYMVYNMRHLIRNTKYQLLLSSVLVYFIYFAQVYTKWTRFMSPLFFIFPLLASYLLVKIKNKKILFLLILIAVLPGVNFLKIYLSPDTRLTASKWIVQNIPQNSIIFSEGGNVVDIPLIDNKLHITNFDFYSLEDNPDKKNELVKKISQSDFIVIPSRRIFKNQSNSNFPVSQKYYTALFNGFLGFTKIKEFSINTSFPLNDENAEETFSVFDHPTIRIYKKIKNLSLEELNLILNT